MYSRTTGLRERGARRGGGANLHVSRIGFVWTTILAVVAGASYATAQTTIEPAPGSQNSQLQARQKAASGGGGGCKGDSGKAVTKTVEGAKWFCKTPAIIRDKVWRGSPITCDFKIENKGTEPLKIHARGG